MDAPSPPPPPPSGVVAGSAAVGAALLGGLLPALEDISGRLVDLQESQQVLLTGVSLASVELAAGDADWRAARETLDRVPAYTARVLALRRAMAAATAAIARADKGAAALQGRLEQKAAERRARRNAEHAAYGGGGGGEPR